MAPTIPHPKKLCNHLIRARINSKTPLRLPPLPTSQLPGFPTPLLPPFHFQPAFERLVEFPAGFDRCFFHGLDGSLFAQFPVRQFEATTLTFTGTGAKISHFLQAREKGPKFFRLQRVPKVGDRPLAMLSIRSKFHRCPSLDLSKIIQLFPLTSPHVVRPAHTETTPG